MTATHEPNAEPLFAELLPTLIGARVLLQGGGREVHS